MNETNVDQGNKSFILVDQKFLLSNSSPVFCARNAETVIIPNFVENIGAYSFNNRKKTSKC